MTRWRIDWTARPARRFWLALVFTAIGICACDESVITGPSGGGDPPPPTTTSTPPEDIPFNPGVTFSWDDTRGILVFAATQASEAQIQALDNRLRMSGWPTPTYHICSETWRWDGTPWAIGTAPFSKQNLDNLRRFLRVTAELGSQVLLDVFCTVRDDKPWMNARNESELKNAERYAITVAEIAKDSDHIAIHVANEPWHQDSWFDERTDRLRLIRDTLRMAGFRGMIGADDNGARPGDTKYDSGYRSLGFWPDFHPWRHDGMGRDLVPTRDDFREMRERNPFGRVVISEPIAYSSWRTGGCCTDNRELVTRNMRDAEAEGLVWFFHGTDNLQWPTLVQHFEWIPEG